MTLPYRFAEPPPAQRLRRAALVAAVVACAWRGVAADSEPQRLFYGFGTAKPDDTAMMRQRGVDAVSGVCDRLTSLGYDTRVMLGSGDKAAVGGVTFAAVTNALAALRQRLGTNDTVILYSHTHGIKGSDTWPGGMLLDAAAEGARDRRRPGLNWADYAEQVLTLPAKTVVILTMACHSGGLVEFLKTDEKARRLWQARREQGRDFVVVTSQNSERRSDPRNINGVVINPFTYALHRALEGAADGYRHGAASAAPDGRLTLGELTQYLVDEPKKHTRAGDAENDADPQLAGAFNPDTVVAAFTNTAAAASAAAPAPAPHAAAALPVIADFRQEGDRWTCTADGTPLSGLLLKPEGEGPFPAVVLSHGLGGNAQAILRARGAALAKAGFVCIATDYTHAGTGGGRADRSGIDFTAAGARPENIRRGLACVSIARQSRDVEPKRIVLYGHSMGAFLTIALAAAAPDVVAAAAITAGGVVQDGIDAAAPAVSVASRVRAPFLVLHGTADTTVPPERSALLKQTLDAQGVPCERQLFEGVGHGLPNDKAADVDRLLRAWFEAHGTRSSPLQRVL